METCKIIMDDGIQCVRPVLCKGMCNTHWGRARNGKVPMGRPFGPTAKEPTPCHMCERPAMAKGLCIAHYQRQFIRPPEKRLMGLDAPVRTKRRSDERKVSDILSVAKWVDNCLVADRVGSDGYASSVKDSTSKSIKSHRLVYRVKNGPIPAGMQIHHTCSNRACINPEHLVLATQKENVGEMLARRSYEQHIKALEAEVARLKALLGEA